MIAPTTGLDPALVNRFGADVARTLGTPLCDGAPLALAVSGGPDSMAMLALAAATFPGAVRAATVDHGLRRAAVDEAAMVARWCADAAIPHRTLDLRDAIGETAIQETARALRYDALGRWVVEIGAAALATAHHADDQAETFLMRAVRGSGPAGLSGVRPRRILTTGADVGEASFTIIRPLLDWRRLDLRTVVIDGAIPFVDDPSNANDHYERVRVRRLLRDEPWLDPVGLARAAKHAGEAQRSLDEMAAWLWDDRMVGEDAAGVALRLGDLPRDLQRQLARRAILHVRHSARVARPQFDYSANVEALLESLAAGSSANQGGVLVSSRDGIWRFCPEPPRRAT